MRLIVFLLACHHSAAVGGRPYYSRVPAHLESPAPLLLLLHPLYPGDGKSAVAMYDLEPILDEKGLLLAAPDGTMGENGLRFWNATNACCAFGDKKPDDVAYLESVVADMKKRYRVDEKRIFVMGYSNGGFMTHRLLCEKSELFAAGASIAGAGWKDELKCQPSRASALLEVHGDLDERVRFSGDEYIPSSAEAIAAWAKKIGCRGPVAPHERGDLMKPTTVSAYDCPTGAAELWALHGGVHRGLHPTMRAAIEWLLAHPH